MTLETSTKHRILIAGLEEIALHGVLGFRLVDVADRSASAVSLIHRHFGGREGLVRAVFEMAISANIQRITSTVERVRSDPNVTIEEVLGLLHPPSSEAGRAFRWFRVQALAASTSDPVLRSFMADSTTRVHQVLKELILALRIKAGFTTEVDLDAGAQMASILGLILINDDLLTEGKFTDESFMELLLRVLLIE